MKIRLITIMMLAGLMLLLSACKKDNAEIGVNNTDILFSAKDAKYELEVGFKDTIRVKIQGDYKNVTYQWTESGKEIGKDSLLVFTPEQEKEYKIKLRITTEKGIAENTCTVIAQSPCKNAMFLVNMGRFEFEQNKIVPFQLDLITPRGNHLKDPLIKANSSFNYTKAGRILPVIIFKDNFYIVSSDENTIYTFNASTMKQVGGAISIQGGSKKWVSFSVATEEKGYLFTRDGEALSVDLKTGNTQEVKLPSRSGYRFYTKMVQPIYNGNLYAMRVNDYEGAELTVINPQDNKVEQTLDFKGCAAQISTIVNNNKLVIIAGRAFSSPDLLYVLSLDSKTMEVNKKELDKSYHNGLCAVPGEQSFIYVTNQKVEVCKYSFDTGKLTVIADAIPVPDDTNRGVQAGMRLKQLFVDYESSDDMLKNTIAVYDTDKSAKKPVTTYTSFVIDQYLHNKF